MSRVQLALNVSDLDVAVDFYARLFGTQPAKRADGYANFAIGSPPLKLVLIENPLAVERLNHLGVEVPDAEQVRAAANRLAGQGLNTTIEDGVTCCYAVQDKVWTDGPDGVPWEIYTVLADSDTPTGQHGAAELCRPGVCADDPTAEASTGCC